MTDPGRPARHGVGTTLPLGFLALFMATLSLATVQLGWLPATEARPVAITVLVLTAPLQLVASVLGFVAGDPVVGTGMGLLAGTWSVVGLVMLSSPPGATSPGLGVVLLAAGTCLLVPAVAGLSKTVASVVIATSAVRFAATGAAQLSGTTDALRAAGWLGVLLAVVSLYAALALALEASAGRVVLPVGRRSFPSAPGS